MHGHRVWSLDDEQENQGYADDDGAFYKSDTVVAVRCEGLGGFSVGEHQSVDGDSEYVEHHEAVNCVECEAG